MKTIAMLLLCSTMIFAQTPRKCDPGYTLQKDGHCVGEFPAGDGCNTITRDQDNPYFTSETSIYCGPALYYWNDGPFYDPNYTVPSPPKEAKITDGETPDYKTVPVTQKIPTCKDGYQLKHFVPGMPGNMGKGYAVIPEQMGTPSYWEDAGPPNADVEWKDYRCFPKEKVNYKGDMHLEKPCDPKESAKSSEGCAVVDGVFVDGELIGVETENSEVPEGIICEKGSHYIAINFIAHNDKSDTTKLSGCYKDGATVTITLP